MDKLETLQVLALLRGAYPAFYRGMSDDEIDGIVSIWQTMFADDDAQAVSAAVLALIATKTDGFPPVVGAVKAEIVKMQTPDEMTEQEAWALVARAIANGIYSASEEFGKLPAGLQRLVGSPNQLREWATMDADAVQSVVASNFQRSYRARRKQEKENLALPSSVRAMISAVAERMALPAGMEGGSETGY